MRLVLFFDLPVETTKQRKDYRIFRKYLIKEGYMMLQKSVYTKLVLTDEHAKREIERLQKNRPPSGLVQVLKVTEKQFATMVYVAGSKINSSALDTTQEFVVI